MGACTERGAWFIAVATSEDEAGIRAGQEAGERGDEDTLRATRRCPSLDDSRLWVALTNGGSGSSVVEVGQPAPRDDHSRATATGRGPERLHERIDDAGTFRRAHGREGESRPERCGDPAGLPGGVGWVREGRGTSAVLPHAPARFTRLQPGRGRAERHELRANLPLPDAATPAARSALLSRTDVRARPG